VAWLVDRDSAAATAALDAFADLLATYTRPEPVENDVMGSTRPKLIP
jgi:hypothetical protein